MRILNNKQECYLSESLLISKCFLIIAFGFVWSFVLALSWEYEEPSKVVTILVCLIVYLTGLFIINYARRTGILVSHYKWIFAFIVKMTVSYLIVKYFWALPLDANNMLRTPEQSNLVTDSNFYDYVAVQVVNNGVLNSIHLFFTTWLSFGVISYITCIYSLFGISIFYVAMFNSLFVLLGVIAIKGIVMCFDQENIKRWDIVRWLMILPYGSYYDAIPSKEPITSGFFYLSLFFIARLITDKTSRNKNIFLFLIGFVFLLLIRPNVGILLLLAPLCFVVKKIGIKKSIVFLSLIFLALFTVILVTTDLNRFLYGTFNLQNRLEIANGFSTLFVKEGSALKTMVWNTLAPRSIVGGVLLSPVRALVWWYLPYPMIIPKFEVLFHLAYVLKQNWYLYFRTLEVCLRMMSTWILLAASPFVISSIFCRKSYKKNGYSFLLLNFMVPLLLISNLMFVMGGRYRVLIEPLFLVLALWGFYNNKRTISNVALFICFYAAFLVGVLIYGLVQ